MRQLLTFGLSVDVVDLLVAALRSHIAALNLTHDGAGSKEMQLARDFLTMLQSKRTEMRD
jgi:hypothetical protein